MLLPCARACAGCARTGVLEGPDGGRRQQQRICLMHDAPLSRGPGQAILCAPGGGHPGQVGECSPAGATRVPVRLAPGEAQVAAGSPIPSKAGCQADQPSRKKKRMKVLLASTIVPFIEGGGTFIVDWLADKLQEYGHQVDVFKIPFHPHPGLLLEQMLALRLLGVRGYGDRLIAIRMPIYHLEHPNKVLWFIHHYRPAYDLWGTEYNALPPGGEGDALRLSIIRADQEAFRSARAIFTNSKIVAERLREHNRLDSEVLYPPLLHPEQFRSTSYGDYLFCASRITSIKRQWLAVEAMNHVRTGVRLVIAGMPDTEVQGRRLRTSLQACTKPERVTVLDRWISEEEKQRWYAGALGALYLPYMEDSYGYPC